MKGVIRMFTPRILKSFKFIIFFTFFTFIILLIISPTTGSAQDRPETILNLPKPGTLVKFSTEYTPTHIKGITINPQNALEFDFIIDKGDSDLMGEEFTREANKLIKYFMAALTVPEAELWVNLSPHENDRIVPDKLGITEMGRDLLAQDYMLKQLTASLMYPKDEIGQTFWDRVHKKAQELYGTTEIPMNTFNKIWIIPEKATVLEYEGTAYVVESKLKVMLEEDYMTLQEEMGNTSQGKASDPDKKSTEITSGIVREVLLPEIENEINTGKTFANLRQINNAIILAEWYKRTLKESLLGQVYVDKNKVTGVDLNDKTVKDKIFNQYVRSFIKGAFNMVQEDYDAENQTTVFRKYFSGGADFGAYGRQPKILKIVSARQAEQGPQEYRDAAFRMEDSLQQGTGTSTKTTRIFKIKANIAPIKANLPNAEAPVFARNLPGTAGRHLLTQATAAVVRAANPTDESWTRLTGLLPEQEQLIVRNIQINGIQTAPNIRLAAESGSLRLRTTDAGPILEVDIGSVGYEALPEAAKIQKQEAMKEAFAKIEASGATQSQVLAATRQAMQSVDRRQPLGDELRRTPAGSAAIAAAESMISSDMVTGSDVRLGQNLRNQPFSVQRRALGAVEMALQVQTGQRPMLENTLVEQVTAASFPLTAPAGERWVSVKSVTPGQADVLRRQIQDSGIQEGPNIRLSQSGVMRLRSTDTGDAVLEMDSNADFAAIPESIRLQHRNAITGAWERIQSSGIAPGQAQAATRQALQMANQRESIGGTAFSRSPAGSAVIQAAESLVSSGVVSGADVLAGQSFPNQPSSVQTRTLDILDTAFRIQSGETMPVVQVARASQAAAAAFQAASPAAPWVALPSSPQTDELARRIQATGIPTSDTDIVMAESGTMRLHRTETGNVIEINTSAGYHGSIPSDIREQQVREVSNALEQVRSSTVPRAEIQTTARRAMLAAESGRTLGSDLPDTPARTAVFQAAETLVRSGVVTGINVGINQPFLNQPAEVQLRTLIALDAALSVDSGSAASDTITIASSAAMEAHTHVVSASPVTRQWVPVDVAQEAKTPLVQNIRATNTALESGFTYTPNLMTRLTPAGEIEVLSSAPVESLPGPLQSHFTQGMREVSDILNTALDQEKLDSRNIQSRLSTVVRQTQQQGERLTADFGSQPGADRIIRNAAQRIIDFGIATPANIRPGTSFPELTAQQQTLVLGALDRGLQTFRAAEMNEFDKGGIDLNPDMLDFQIKRDGQGVPLPVIQQPLESLDIEGFLPVIVDIAPFTNVPRF